MRRRRSLFVALFFLLFALPFLNCRRGTAVPEDPARIEAERFLLEYLRIDTSNPPGGETQSARFLQLILQANGIESRLMGDDPQRLSLYARLPSRQTAPGLVLLHHMDVVPANPTEWSVAPFAGVKNGGYIWGRGALDIKSLGVAQLMAFLDLKRSGAVLSRDVIFLAVADEEAGSAHGVAYLLRQHPDLFKNVGFVLNEGGSTTTIVDKVSYWGIETAQKVPLWIRITVRRRPTHSAVPPADGGSAALLLPLLQDLLRMPMPYRVVPAAEESLRAFARTQPGRRGELLRDVRRYVTAPEFDHIVPEGVRAVLRDTVAVTQLKAGIAANLMPASASATLDFRLLPDQPVETTLAKIRAIVGNRAEIEVLLEGKAAPASPINTPLFAVLSRNMKAAEPSSVVGPVFSPGTSDSRFFRAKGIVAYGVSPFKVNYYDADTVHGIDERIRTEFFHQGVRLMKRVTREFCASKG